MLVSCKDMLAEAYAHGKAIPSPDFVDSNSVRAFTRVAEQLNAPIILSFAEVHMDHMSVEEAALMGKFYAQRASVPPSSIVRAQRGLGVSVTTATGICKALGREFDDLFQIFRPGGPADQAREGVS